MPVSLGISPDSRWDTTPGALAAATAAAGFDALGVLASDATEAAAAYRTAGLRCHEVLALVVVDDGPAVEAASGALADAAAAMGAEWVLAIFAAAPEGDLARALERCAARFDEVGAGLAVEFSPMGPVSSIPRGLEVVRRIAATGARSGLLIDTWHFFHGDSTWEDLASVPLEEVAYVQFDDALAPDGSGTGVETMHRRALPGEGVLELDRFASTLLERGFEGTVSVEVLSAELRSLPVEEIALRCHRSAAPFWT